MIRKIDKKRVYNAGKGKANQELIHLHMSNHYRRILNAKKAVDNSPPYCYKAKVLKSSIPLRTKERTPFENLALTDRSLSTNSNKDSFWGGESYAGSSRYHTNCVPEWQSRTASKRSYNNMDLVNRITYDTKNGPATYCDEYWTQTEVQQDENQYKNKNEIQQKSNDSKCSSSAKRSLPTANSNDSGQKRKFPVQKLVKRSGITNKGTKPFPSLEDKISRKTLKNEAVSKLRSLRVYHPPRRRERRDKTENSSGGEATSALEAPDCNLTKICVCDASETVLKKISFNPKEQSQTSSRDSAYNGGVSSLPESRSPTPDQRRKKECSCCCCCCCERKRLNGKPFVSSKESASSGEPAPEFQHQESFKKLQEDALYVKFIQDITTEILEKNLYTNKALKKVMKKHIQNNLKNLNKDRLLKEVENLRIQLGIPEDNSLLELRTNGGLGFYPVISDSEFVMPKPGAARSEKFGPTVTKTFERIGRSISTVISSSREKQTAVSGSETENGGVISVIQVTKAVRERRTEKASGKTPYSDDSDRPSDPKKRSVLKTRKPKFTRGFSSSSSESEGSVKFSIKVGQDSECDDSTSKETYLGDFLHKPSPLCKKNRCVSFWKCPDSSPEQKRKGTRGTEADPQERFRGKPKHD